MTNLSHDMNCQEEFRIEFCYTKLIGLKRAVFKVLSSSKRKDIGDDSDPLLKQVKATSEKIVTGAKYHDTSSNGVQDIHNKTDFMDLKSVESFMEETTPNFIPKMYQKVAYLKDKLIKIYATCVELAEVLENDESTGDEELTIDLDRKTNVKWI
eukprot:1676037-Ditylum_brightwellii.AAC.1